MTPPATEAYRAAHNVASGPSQAPRQASSLTSPAPIPPSSQNGRNSAVPASQPPTLVHSPAAPCMYSEKMIAAAAPPKVNRLGIRLDRKSQADATTPRAIATIWPVSSAPNISCESISELNDP